MVLLLPLLPRRGHLALVLPLLLVLCSGRISAISVISESNSVQTESLSSVDQSRTKTTTTTPRDRTCCRYSSSSPAPAATSSSSSLCQTKDACVVSDDGSNNLVSPSLEQCNVVEDSKKDGQKDAKHVCLARRFRSDDDDSDDDRYEDLPFKIRTFLFADSSTTAGTALPGIEVDIEYSSLWSAAKFRLVNRALCKKDEPEENPACSPRCVEILKNHLAHVSNASLRYDCEVGFYKTAEEAVVLTSGDTYTFDICMDHIAVSDDDAEQLPDISGDTAGLTRRRKPRFGVKCSSFFFTMPEAGRGGRRVRSLPLLDQRALEQDGLVIVHFPGDFLDNEGRSNGTLELFSRLPKESEGKEGGNWQLVVEKTVVAADSSRYVTVTFGEVDDLRLPAGQYRISYRDLQGQIVIAAFSVPESDSRAALGVAIFAIITAIVVLLLSFYIYRRYRSVRASSMVDPIRLLGSGRIKGKSVFVITNVDNRHHIDVVMAFNRYLKTYCGVSEVYYALDDKTGVRSQAEHDPWKWAQDVAAKLEATEDSCIVFIGSTPPGMGLSIYTDLPNNQAFVAAKYLKHMVDENRVAILLFPYSDPATIPTLVPAHVRAKPYKLPLDMNDFLCQLLDVKKRALFSCLPVLLVKPQVLPHDLKRCGVDGERLLEKISSLTAMVERHQAEQAHAAAAAAAGGAGGVGACGSGGAASTLSRTEETASTLSDSEERKLLTPKKVSSSTPVKKKEDVNPASSSELKIEIEPGIMSLRDGAAAKRDRRVNPEFADL